MSHENKVKDRINHFSCPPLPLSTKSLARFGRKKKVHAKQSTPEKKPIEISKPEVWWLMDRRTNCFSKVTFFFPPFFSEKISIIRSKLIGFNVKKTLFQNKQQLFILLDYCNLLVGWSPWSRYPSAYGLTGSTWGSRDHSPFYRLQCECMPIAILSSTVPWDLDLYNGYVIVTFFSFYCIIWFSLAYQQSF